MLFKDVKLLFIIERMQLKELFKNNLRFSFEDKSKNLLIIEMFRLTKFFFDLFKISEILFNRFI